MRIPTSSSKSHLPNWLDKLRKVKGFPSDDDGHSLDHFLSQQPQHQQQQQGPNEDFADGGQLYPVKRRASMPENDDVSTRMANMLSDLFSDGRSSRGRSSNFKAPRKQPSPRICILPVVTEDKGSNESDRVVVEDDGGCGGFVEREVNRNPGLRRKEERRKLGECDLVGFSRTEVTVIDSSNPLWKFDKYLFRKKNVWKARDCGRGVRRHCENDSSVGIGRKKKREGMDDDDDDYGVDDRIVVSKKHKSFGGRR